MQDFKDLLVWQKAHRLALGVYRATGNFPKAEMYGLTSQIRRATVSISANIAEGRGCGTDAGFRRYLHIALASSFELACHVMLAKDLEFMTPACHDQLIEQCDEVRRMLAALIGTLKE